MMIIPHVLKKRAAAALLFLFALAAAAPASSAASERWYLLTIGGNPVGYIHETEGPAADGLRASSVEMRIVLNRLGKKVDIRSRSEYREDAAGRIVSFASETRLSDSAVRSEGVVEEGAVRLKTVAGSSVQERTIPFTGELLGPLGIRDLGRGRLRGPGDAVEFQTFSTELGQVLKGSRRALARETLEIGGRAVPALKVEESLAGLPFRQTAWLDDGGDDVKSSEPSPFGDVVGIVSDRATALAAAEGGRLPEDSYRQTLIRANVRLPRARQIESATLRLRRRGENPPAWPDLDLPFQKVLRKTETELDVRVDRPDVSRRPDVPAQPRPEDTEANAYLDSDDPLIRKTAAEVAGAVADPWAKALRLKSWVDGAMTFDLGIVSPPAAEVIRNRRGTCVGYAMLLTSLARAAGLPARFLMGYVYVNGIWGGHAWSEVLVDGRWVPIDAAVNGPGAADAARLCAVQASLSTGLSEALLGAQGLYGDLAIDVLEYVLDGRKVEVPRDQGLYEIDGDRYRNLGLGLAVTKPAGFEFEGVDDVWPSPRLVAMTGPGGRTAEVAQEGVPPARDPAEECYALVEKHGVKGRRGTTRLLGTDAYTIRGEKAAGAALPNGTDVWVIYALGKDAPALLDRVLKSFRLDSVAPAPRAETR